MGRFRFLICLVAVSLFPLTVQAEKGFRLCKLGTKLSAVSLNAAAASRTFTAGPTSCNDNMASYTYLVIEAAYTHSNSDDLVITCTVGGTVATATKTPQLCTGAGTCTANDAGIFSKAVTGDKNFAVRMGIRGFPAVSCVASHATAGAGDILTVIAYLTD